jgi:tetratricopeptide (TPR) repeat protein
MVLGITGCSKQRAELSLKKATANVQQAREWNADKFDESKGALEAAENAIKAAQQALTGQSFSQALSSAQEAVRQSKQAIDNARTRYADQVLQEARRAVEVARINDGDKENPDLFKKAETSLQTASEKYQKQKYEDSIKASRETLVAVDQLLAHLKNAAINKLDELKGKLKELELAEAEKYQPQAIVRTRENIDNITKKIEKDRDYKQAIILCGQAITDAENGIIETKKTKAQAELRYLESKIAEARADEAIIYAPDRLQAAETSFQSLMVNYVNNQFDTVLNTIPQLKPQIEDLVTVTRIEATKDKIASVEKAIKTLRDEAVDTYLPGRVEVMEQLLKEARDLFNNNDFDTAKEKASQGLIENDRIVAAFDQLAEKHILDAQQAWETCSRTLDKMDSFFQAQPKSAVVDQRLEVRRQTEAENLASQRDAAALKVRDAKSARSERRFKRAVELAQEAKQISDQVVSRTFRIVAEHALIAVQDELSDLERKGAREYAAQGLSQVQQLVEETQQLLSQDKNRQAAELTAKARAYLENVKQLLAERAHEEQKRTEELLRRIEGSAPRVPSVVTVKNDSPGGGEGNDKFAHEEASELLPKPFVIAQLAQQNIMAGPDSSPSLPLSNERMPAGTIMKSDTPVVDSNLAGKTGAPTGATVGTRPVPVSSGTAPKAEGTLRGDPFVAANSNPANSSSPTMAPANDSAEGIRVALEQMLQDERRLRDIRKYQPGAIAEARRKLQESSDALITQDYLKSLEAAKEAQRILLAAETNAARAAAKANLKSAADRINLAEAAGAIMFAPAQLTEAIALYEQAEKLLANGQYREARDVSEQALTAADDARLYNVRKAQDLAALSVQYGGWKAAHPLLVEAEQNAAVAEELLGSAETAAQGQELAKEAVKLAQMALDHSRDYTFQERLDNIYRALNQALRAGANYFNVEEVKSLIAEIAQARDEYCTRNFDAVEMRLKDIEAGLARVIETTPLVLEQNLQENTARLNALIEAGAENYMAQEVDDVKTLMNRAAVDFRKGDYQSSYVNMKKAIELTDQIENRLQEQVYFDAVSELLAQLDDCFQKFDVVLSHDPTFIKQLIEQPNGLAGAVRLSGKMSPNDFKDAVRDIYLRTIHLKPPKSQEATHEQVILAVKHALVAAENFQKLLILDQVSLRDAYDIIDTAYNQIAQAKKLRGEVQMQMIDPQARTKIIRAEKILNF